MPTSIEAVPLGPVAVAARAWRSRGRRVVTVIVKITCKLEHDAHMTVISPAPIATEERHFRNNPVASLTRASDLALLVPRPELVVVGSAFAAPGRPVSETTVRLALQRDTTMLINKRLEITGDRRCAPGREPPKPEPFQSMPIRYERALGGISSRENPVGVGLAPDPDGLVTFPNVTLRGDTHGEPAGLGPIPSAWPVRAHRRGSMGWSAANTSLDVEVPEDFDDAYYQTAPSDQRTAEIRGGDLLAIVNMHPEIPMLRSYLPLAKGVALAQTRRGDRIPLALRIDTLHIEPDVMRAEIVFRAATVLHEADASELRIAGALEHEAPFDFPDLTTLIGTVAKPASTKSVAEKGFDTTAALDEPAPAAQRFGGTMLIEADAQPVPVVAPPPAVVAQPNRGFGGTMIIEPDAPLPAPVAVPVSAPRSPRRGKTPPPFKPPMVPEPKIGTATMTLEVDEKPKSLPFAKGRRPERSERPAPREGTPWGDAPVQPAVPALSGDDAAPNTRLLAAGTLPIPPNIDLDDVTVDQAAPAPPKASPPEPPPPEPQPQVSPWRIDPTPEPAPPPARPAPKPARANLKGDLYKKLKR